MMQEDAELFQAYGAEFTPDYRREHWAQGPSPRMSSPTSAVPLPASVSSNSSTPSPFHPPSSTAPLPASVAPSPIPGGLPTSVPGAPSHGSWQQPNASTQLPPVSGMTRNAGHEVWQGNAWVTNTSWDPGHEGDTRINSDGFKLVFRRGDWVRSDEVSQIVIFSDGSFRVYYLDGRWRRGRSGEQYPAGYPVFHDVATLPVGPRFSFFLSGVDAYRLDNVTGDRVYLGQYMPDGRVLVGSVLYHPRHDGTLEWVGPTSVGQNPQADANLAALAETVKKEAAKSERATAATVKAKRETSKHHKRHSRKHDDAPVMGRPAPMVVATSALPQAIGTTPAYVIAASASPTPSLEEIAEIAAEAGYEGAQLAVEESEAEAFAAPPVLVEEFDVFGGDQTGGLGFDYQDPRTD
jgi:hypothetical protein